MAHSQKTFEDRDHVKANAPILTSKPSWYPLTHGRNLVHASEQHNPIKDLHTVIPVCYHMHADLLYIEFRVHDSTIDVNVRGAMS